MYGNCSINQSNNCYVKVTDLDEKAISNFIIQPIEGLLIDGREYLISTLINQHGHLKNVTLPPEVWQSKKLFLSIVNSSLDFTFTGDVNDLQNIANLISQQPYPKSQAYSSMGIYKQGTNWVLITDGSVINSSGAVNKQLYFGDGSISSSIATTEIITAENLSRLLPFLSDFNTLFVVASILAWLVAVAFKARLFHLDLPPFGRTFPILSCFGEQGSGKTATVLKLILETYGLGDEIQKSIPQLTKFTIMKMSASTNFFPLYFDEYKEWLLTKSITNIISETIRTTYNASIGERGISNFKSVKFQYTAPIVITGEGRFTESALRERIIEVNFSKRKSAEHLDSFLKMNNENLAELGRLIIHHAITMSDAEIVRILKEEYEAVNEIFTGRLRTNVAIGRFGLRILGDIIMTYTKVEFTVKPGDFEASQFATLFNEVENRSLADKIVAAIFLLLHEDAQNDKLGGSYKLVRGFHYAIINGFLRIHLPTFYHIFINWAKSRKIELEYIDQRSMLKILQDEPYYEGYKNYQMEEKSTKVKRCVSLTIATIAEKGIEIYDLKG